MMLVKTKIGPSKIHGIGLFADQPIKKGTVVWKFVPGFDLKFTDKEIEKFPQVAKDFLATYGYGSPTTGYHVLAIDNARFYNHSKKPNTVGAKMEGTENEDCDIATKDIKIGEEITYDYEVGDAHYKQKLNPKSK